MLLTAEQHFVSQVLAREDLYFFSRYSFLCMRGYPWLRGPHHQQICDALMRVYNGEINRLIINIPPRYSKTELAVVDFVAWTLGRHPDSEYIIPSYAASLAEGNSWKCRELVSHEVFAQIFPGVEVRSDSSAKKEWRTSQGGCVFAPGVGGSCTGYGAGKQRNEWGGCIIVDDPHKADEARSDVIRNGVIEWFQNTLESRKNDPKRTPIIVIMQRLHESDLAGWLKDGGNGEDWTVLSLPAIQVNERGEEFALWPEKHDLEMLQRMRNASPYNFAGQYMQSPSAPEGNIFKPANINIIDAMPAGENIRWVRAWDLAASTPERGKTDPDWTVGLKMGLRPNGRLLIAHVNRDRGTPDYVEKMICSTAMGDGRGVLIRGPQDPGQAGKSQVTYFSKLLRGFRFKFLPVSGDKITRAEPFASQVNVGNVDMLAGEWNGPLLSEFALFPNGNHDDIVDAASDAFNELTGTGGPLLITEEMLRRI